MSNVQNNGICEETVCGEVEEIIRIRRRSNSSEIFTLGYIDDQCMVLFDIA
jgi:hypothetical protein